MNKKQVILSTGATTLLMSPIITIADSLDSTLDQNKQEQNQMKQFIEQIQNEKKNVQEQIETVQEKIHSYENNLIKMNKDIQSNEMDVNELKEMIDRLEKESKRINTFLAEREDGFKKRVAAYYRNEGDVSFLSVVFNASSFGELIDHVVSYRKIVDSDKKFIKKYLEEQNNVKKIKKSAQQMKDFQEMKIKEIEQMKESVQLAKIEKEELSKILKEKKKQLEVEEKEKKNALQVLKKNEKQIQEVIEMINNPNYQGGGNVVQKVIAPFILDAQRIQEEKGVHASIILGQIILESSGRYNGLSGLAYEGKNLFGIKGTGTAGSITMNTYEYYDGQKVTVPAQFAKYATYYDSMLAHANLLTSPRYQRYLRNAQSVEEYARGIQEAGYATDPNYSSRLIGIIHTYGLTSFDI